MHNANFWEECKGYLQCNLCPHRCRLEAGQWGLCGARSNRNGSLCAESYGKIAAIHIDPVEKKPLRHFLPGSKTLSIGCNGCNLFCPYCQNNTLARNKPQENAAYFSPGEIINKALELDLPSISYTYNEPGTFFEYMLDCAKLAKQNGLSNIMVTNGYLCKEPRDELLQYIDAMNIDVKSSNAAKFKETCGGSLNAVWDNVEKAVQKCHVEMTCLMVPGLCEPDSVETIAEWLGRINREIPMHITRFFPFGMGGEVPTPLEKLSEAKERAEKYLNRVYIGNV